MKTSALKSMGSDSIDSLIIGLDMSISVTLRISGELLDPENITKILSVIPRIARRKGDVRISSSKKEIVSKSGLWTWKTEDLSNVLTINDHIAHLANTFKHAHTLLNKLPTIENAWVDICIVDDKDFLGDTSISLLLNIESITALAEIGLPVEFTIYPLLSEDNQE
jgi:hypothetical protein